MRIEPMHQAGEELLDALRERLGWRPLVTSFEAALWPWLWRAVRPLIGDRVISLRRTWYVGDPSRLLDAPWVLAMVAHEGTHALAARRQPFYAAYFLPQILLACTVALAILAAVRGLLPAWAPWLTLVACAYPWPAPARAMLEAEAYAVQIGVMRCFRVERNAAIAMATQALAHPAYWMTPWPWRRALLRVYHAMVLHALWDPRARLTGWSRDVQAVATAWSYAPEAPNHD